MSELQSCGPLVNAAALCGRSRGGSLEFSAASASLNCEEEQEEKDENVNVVAEISAELQRERQKNMELMKKISFLEAQLQERKEQYDCPTATERIFKKFKRQKIEPSNNGFEDTKTPESKELPVEMKNQTPCVAIEGAAQQDCLVNWMSMDDTSCMNFEKFRNGDLTADCEETDESEVDGDEFYAEYETEVGKSNKQNEDEVSIDGENTQYSEKPHCKTINEGVLFPNARFRSCKEFSNKRMKDCKTQSETAYLGKEIVGEGTTSILSNKNPLKVPFCPKEIKRIYGSEELLLKNAQAHTIRKIIVFASLGIRHGFEDLYELDFNHFSILQKGEPYMSPKNPGEHVLYEHPGVRRRIFYPNRQNPTLCPVQILEEENAMRPSDLNCPSYLFLCIKYGGRTRNIPQNEYVRQRMGRNKLKSFGPLMCRLAMLVHVRSGSFFFKALGITLLFMAGFSDDLVQRETKYQNLDLLLKYYRTDEEAEGEELFHSDSMLIDVANPDPKQLMAKATKKLGSKKQMGSSRRSQYSPVSSVMPSTPCSSSQPPTQFGLTGYPSIQSQTMPRFWSMPPLSVADTTISNTPISTSMLGSLPSYHSGQMMRMPNPYPNFPQNAANMFMPMVYCPHPSAFPSPSFPYSTFYGYQSFPHSGNYMSFQSPQPYYTHPLPFMPRTIGGAERKRLAAMEDATSESDSSSSSTKEGVSKL